MAIKLKLILEAKVLNVSVSEEARGGIWGVLKG